MRHLFVASIVLAGCSTDPLQAALPSLPPEGGPAITAAGRLTDANFAQERVPGPASLGLVGDYFMRNDKVRLVVQAPGRAIGPCPFGGNVIDLDRADDPAGDQLGEVSPFLQLGRTLNWERSEIVRDGSKGGPAVLRFYGHDAKDDFINIPGLGSFAIAIQDDYRADIDLGWKAAVTYVLMPGETKVRMIYTFYNPKDVTAATTWGTLSDTGAGPEIFHPYLGFGELSFNEIVASSKNPPVKWAAFQGHGAAYGIVPIYDDPAAGGASVPVAGVDVEVFNLTDQFDAFGMNGQSLSVKAGGTATREVDLVLAPDVGGVTAQAHAIRGEATAAFAGTTEPGARVAVLDPSAASNAQLLTTLTADAAGHFSGALPAGTYRLQAEGTAYRRSSTADVTLPGAADVKLDVAAAGSLTYTVKDRAGAASPAKIIVVGAPANPPDRRFRDVTTDGLPYGVAAWAFSRHGDSARNETFDRALPLAAGRYRVVISRGPEWSRFEQVVDVTAGAAVHVDAVLDHVAPTPGYAACDFHQHSHMSPDARAAPEDRVMSYLADGADFISSSEHDVLFDYEPLITQLDARDLLASAVGVETTAWDYGHYIGFPLAVDPLSPNGGALDWGAGEGLPHLTPPQIYDGLRAQGAKVVQVNHPRSSPGDFSSFQQSFDRAGLRFDFAAHTFFGDKSLMPVSSLILGLPDGAPLFSPTFDTHEIYNGHHLPVMPVDGERIDQRVDINLRDWMNFLSFGFTPTPTGVSDSHEWISSPGALPRTLVRVPDDSSAALAAGITDAVTRSLSGQGVAHDVIVTNGPFLQLSVDGKGIGSTVSHAASGQPLTIHISVTSPGWMPVDMIEIFSNQTFDIPAPKGSMPQPLVPALCFTTRPVPSARCAMGLGGARPMTITATQTVPGVASSTRFDISIDVTDVTPDQLLMRQRAGATGKDLWLVARATGGTGLFPVLPGLVDATVPMTELVDTPNLAGRGIPALAFTHAIFVDVDGGGWRGPFQP